jgi:hypothetical protein
MLLLLLQAVNRSEFANDDSKQAEKRLKDLMAGAQHRD